MTNTLRKKILGIIIGSELDDKALAKNLNIRGFRQDSGARFSSKAVRELKNNYLGIINCKCGCGKRIIGIKGKEYYNNACRQRYRTRALIAGCWPIKKWVKCKWCGEYIPRITVRTKFCMPEYMDRKCSVEYRNKNKRGVNKFKPKQRESVDRNKNWREDICFKGRERCINYLECLGNPFDDKEWKWEKQGKGDSCYEANTNV